MIKSSLDSFKQLVVRMRKKLLELVKSSDEEGFLLLLLDENVVYVSIAVEGKETVEKFLREIIEALVVSNSVKMFGEFFEKFKIEVVSCWEYALGLTLRNLQVEMVKMLINCGGVLRALVNNNGLEAFLVSLHQGFYKDDPKHIAMINEVVKLHIFSQVEAIRWREGMAKNLYKAVKNEKEFIKLLKNTEIETVLKHMDYLCLVGVIMNFGTEKAYRVLVSIPFIKNHIAENGNQLLRLAVSNQHMRNIKRLVLFRAVVDCLANQGVDNFLKDITKYDGVGRCEAVRAIVNSHIRPAIIAHQVADELVSRAMP